LAAEQERRHAGSSLLIAKIPRRSRVPNDAGNFGANRRCDRLLIVSGM